MIVATIIPSLRIRDHVHPQIGVFQIAVAILASCDLVGRFFSANCKTLAVRICAG